MALLDAELSRIRYELGYNLLDVGAEPYIGVTSAFELVIQPNLRAGATTTSSTSVPAQDPAKPFTITLASATGFLSGQRVVVDVDDQQEVATARALSGAALTLILEKEHTGTYPVTVEGGETIVRELLANIRETKTRLGASEGEGSLKKVDEIEFYQSGGTGFGNLGSQLFFWREELSAALGIESLWARKRRASVSLSVY